MKSAFSAEKWLALVVSLPTVNATLRMRVWRAMKGLGCAVLREGVYLLPAGRGLRQALRMHAEDIKQGGGSAYLLNVTHPSTEEKSDFQGLFDRTDDYLPLMGRVADFKAAIGSIDAAAGRRQLKALWRDFEELVALDYFSVRARSKPMPCWQRRKPCFWLASPLANHRPRRAASPCVMQRTIRGASGRPAAICGWIAWPAHG